jgi:hypothetical protein
MCLKFLRVFADLTSRVSVPMLATPCPTDRTVTKSCSNDQILHMFEHFCYFSLMLICKRWKQSVGDENEFYVFSCLRVQVIQKHLAR